MARQTAQKWLFGKGDTSLEIEILLVETAILLQRSRYFLRKVRYFFRNRDTSMEMKILLWRSRCFLSRYFLLSRDTSSLSRDTSSLSREASVVLSFFCSLHHCSLCRIILNENEATFSYSDKKLLPQLQYFSRHTAS